MDELTLDEFIDYLTIEYPVHFYEVTHYELRILQNFKRKLKNFKRNLRKFKPLRTENSPNFLQKCLYFLKKVPQFS